VYRARAKREAEELAPRQAVGAAPSQLTLLPRIEVTLSSEDIRGKIAADRQATRHVESKPLIGELRV